MSTVVPKLATLKTKQGRKAASDANRPTGNTIAHLLNIYFATYDVKNKPSLRFKAVPHRKGSKTEFDFDAVGGKPFINVRDCLAITSYANVCAQLQQAHPETKLTKEELAAVTENTFDGRLRGLLEIAAKATIKPETSEKQKRPKKTDQPADQPKEPRKQSENAFEKRVIPHLGLGFPNTKHALTDYFKVINDFFADDDRLRLRCYNLCFPHAARKSDSEAKGTNLVYLQHLSKFHDMVLQGFVEGADELTILGGVQSDFANTFPRTGLKIKSEDGRNVDIDDASFERLKLQLRNAEILDKFVNPPSQNWPKTLTVIKTGKGGKGQVNTDEPLRPVERNAVAALLRELHIVQTFLRLMKTAFAANPDRNPADCFDQYNAILDEIKDFHKTHKPKTQNYNTFIKFLVESVLLCKDKFGYRLVSTIKAKDGTPKQLERSALTAFAAELRSGLSFKFNKEVRTGIDELLDGKKQLTDENIIAVASLLQKDWNNFSSVATVDVTDLNFYSKLGKIVPAAIGKQHKVAVGIALIQYIFDQIRLIQAEHSTRKGTITVFVHA